MLNERWRLNRHCPEIHPSVTFFIQYVRVTIEEMVFYSYLPPHTDQFTLGAQQERRVTRGAFLARHGGPTLNIAANPDIFNPGTWQFMVEYPEHYS
jgi:hypothetical protein